MRSIPWVLAFGCSVAVTAYTSVAENDDGLVASWDISAGHGMTIHDSSGRGNHGQIHGARWVQTAGGHALRFNGVDDCVDCGNGESLDLSRPLTLEA